MWNIGIIQHGYLMMEVCILVTIKIGGALDFRLKDGTRRCQFQNGERFSGADDLVLIANVEQVLGRRILARENQQVRSDHSCQEN